MCRLQFYRNIQKKSTNPSIRTLVSTLQCRFLCVFRILPYAHSANGETLFFPLPHRNMDLDGNLNYSEGEERSVLDVMARAVYVAGL